MPDSLLLVAWAIALLGAITVAHVAVTALLGAELPARLRLLIGVIAIFVAQYLGGLLLVAAGVFGPAATRSVLSLLVIAALALLRTPRHRGLVLADFNELRHALASASRAQTALVALPLLLAWVQATRGIVTPPLDWDFLTYHGPRAAFWLQESQLWPTYDAVGLWQMYRAFPPAGDLISAWAMSVTNDDLLVAPAWFAVWVALGLAAYAGARSLGAARWPATLAALAVLLLPASFQHMSSGYVDNWVAAGALAGTACLIESERRKSLELATVSLVAFATSAATKHTALPLAVIAVLLWCRQAYLYRTAARWPRIACVGLVALVTGTLWYAVLAVREGNPMYPFPLNVLGTTLPGARDALPADGAKPRLDFLSAGRALFLGGFLGNPLHHNGFGLGGLLLLLWGSGSSIARRHATSPVLAAMLVSALGLLLWTMAGRIGEPGLDDARYLLTVPGLAALGAAVAPRAPLVLGIVVALEAVHAVPWRWGAIDTVPLLASGGVAALITVALRFAKRIPLGLALGLLGGWCCAAETRGPLRWEYYRSLASGGLMASGPVAFCPSSRAHDIWQHLAEAPPLTINVSAGNHELLTNWFIYPLLGTRFQHRLVHVRTGLHFPEQQRDLTEPKLDGATRAWMNGVARANADAIVLYKPLPIEAKLAWRARPAFDDAVVDTRGALMLSLR